MIVRNIWRKLLKKREWVACMNGLFDRLEQVKALSFDIEILTRTTSAYPKHSVYVLC